MREPRATQYDEDPSPPLRGCAWALAITCGIALILLCLWAAVALAAPRVEIFTLDVVPQGQEFEARAEAQDCSPKSWSWHIDGGVIAVPAKGDTATVICRTERCRLRAVATGGGCARAEGSYEVVALAPPGTVPPCLDTAPQRPVRVSSWPWAYQPSVLSTGRLDLRLRGWVEVCSDPPRGVRR